MLIVKHLVKNPSFETGEFSDWAYWRNAPISLGLLKNRYDGNKGVRVNGQASLYQNIETVPGKKYKLTAFSRPEAGSYVNIGLKPAQEKREPYVSNSDSSDWTKSEIIFTASETTTLIYAYIPREGDSAVVDNFIVQELPNQGDVVVKAKSFETNNMEVTAYPNPSSNGLFTINNTSGYKMIRVYSLTGAKVFEKTINKVKNVKVDLSGLSGEFFMVKLDNSEMLRVVKK